MFVRLFKIKSPGSVADFTNFIDDTSSMKLFEIKEYITSIFYFPELDPYSLNF